MRLWAGLSSLEEEEKKMKNKACRIAAYILGILPIVVLGILYSKLPARVPVHWSLDGTVDYGDKVQLWLFFGLTILLIVMMDFLPKIDPKRGNYERFGKYYDLFVIAMVLFMDIMCSIQLVESFMPGTVNIERVVISLVGCLFIVTGNILPKTKTNFYMGIKTPWTLSHPDVWNKTHRLGGRIMFVVGIMLVVAGILLKPQIAVALIIVGSIIIGVVPMVMSFVWYRRVEK